MVIQYRYWVLDVQTEHFSGDVSYIPQGERPLMARLDLILSLVFGATSLLTLAASAFCMVRALKAAREKDGELRMFFWAVGSMAGLVVAGMSAAYILLPILWNALR
jgi:hypothetical protein